MANSSSGFISASVSSDPEQVEEEDVSSSENSSSTSSTESLGSFKFFVQNYTKPYTRSYNQFGTSYLCQDVPFDRILCEDSESYTDIETKFVNPVAIEEYEISQKSRQALGPSVRKQFIVPSIQQVWRDIDRGQRSIEDGRERVKFLYLKARQWCEVNKALTMDHKYPKPDSNVVRQKYSTAHQKAVKLVRKDMMIEPKTSQKKEPIFIIENVSPYSRPMVEHFLREIEAQKRDKNEDIFVGYDAGQNCFDQNAKEKWDIWTKALEDVFAEITPLPELQNVDKHWQAKAAIGSEKTRRKLETVKNTTGISMRKRFWKRNTYPPMTLEDRIAEKRKLLPPLKSEGLDVDYLSGIWEPALMVDEFTITPVNFDSRLKDDGHGREVIGPDPISWWDAHEATQKCWKWLKTIPDNL